MTEKRFLPLTLFAAAAALLLFWNLHRVPLFDPDEGRYSDMAQTMVRTGDWLVPRMNGIVHLHKPPLSNWLVAASFTSGGASEFTARLPSVLLSLAVLAGMILLGTYLFDFKSGLYGGWALLTSALYIGTSRLVTTDMPLFFFTFTAMSSAARLFFGTRHPVFFFYTMFVCLALAMLTKGPVAWMITLVPVTVFSVWRKRGFAGISKKHWAAALLLFAFLSLSWYLLIALKTPGAFDYFVRDQLLHRIVKGSMGRPKPLYYYFAVLPAGFLPWSLFAFSACYFYFKKSAPPPEVREKIRFLLLWFLVPFALFCSFKTKLATYIVPLLAPLALFVGYYLKDLEEGRAPVTRTVVVFLWLIPLAYLGFIVSSLAWIAFMPHYVAGLPAGALWAMGLLLGFVSAASFFFLVRKKFLFMINFQIFSLVLVGLLAFQALPWLHYKNAKGFAEKILELRRPGDIPVMYRDYFASLPFYLNGRVVAVGVPGTETAFESEDVIRKYVFGPHEDIVKFLRGAARVFVVSKQKDYDSLEKSSPGLPLYPLLRQEKRILFSNQP